VVGKRLLRGFVVTALPVAAFAQSACFADWVEWATSSSSAATCRNNYFCPISLKIQTIARDGMQMIAILRSTVTTAIIARCMRVPAAQSQAPASNRSAIGN